MSTYDDRIKKQSPENQNIYYAWYAWIKDSNLDSKDDYKSAVTEFLEFRGDCSILEIKSIEVKEFRDIRSLKPTRKASKLRYLKNFLAFVNRYYSVRWDFTVDELKILLPNSDELKASITTATPLNAKELIGLYGFFNDNIKEQKWLKVYTIFRLMYNYDLDKFDIAEINAQTYDLQTGKFHKKNSSSPTEFDKEIVSIFQMYGSDFLPQNHTDVYDLLKEIKEILGRNITQEVIKRTKNRFKIRCPQCGELIENNPSLFGFVQIDLLNLESLIVCKVCLENEI